MLTSIDATSICEGNTVTLQMPFQAPQLLGAGTLMELLLFTKPNAYLQHSRNLRCALTVNGSADTETKTSYITK